VRILRSIVILLMLCPVVMGQHDHPAEATKPAQLLAGLGDHHHPIATRNAEAQKFFDQGLTLIFGFNHDESVRSFQRAADLDRNPRNPRSLFGLAESLKAQKKLADAEWVRRGFEAAWKNSDATLRIADL